VLQVSVGVKPRAVVNAFINQVLGRFGTNRNVGAHMEFYKLARILARHGSVWRHVRDLRIGL
jgi:hypothetical protein